MMGTQGNWMVTTPSTDASLGLVLQVIRDGSDLRGFAATGDMTGMSRMTGSIDTSGQFTVTMTQVDGKGPQGSITRALGLSNGAFLGRLGIHRRTAEDRALCAMVSPASSASRPCTNPLRGRTLQVT
jgi:hypothetical protein